MHDQIHVGRRVRLGDRSGIVETVMMDSRRGLRGGKCCDVWVRFDDGGPPLPCNPDDLRDEADDDRR